MQKVSLLILFIVFLLNISFYPLHNRKDLWQSWKTIQESGRLEKRPVIVDIYADWCVYCHKMDATTYKNDSVYQYLKEHYYRFKFNGESKDTLEWNDKKFAWNRNYKLHDFYIYLANGNLAFPTTAIITPDGQPFATVGFIEMNEMESLLKYFVTAYPAISFEEFNRSFKPSWK